uniref:phosphoserine transaminase n=1 Tax=Strombidium rassoulzadegani TaxID=1082188 RepID=A0A7S3CTX4_9SPIT|mmetsp:Transcript_8635/g.14611  ORF Transcript_8635/g.14611 Transcript_8635/m.14611 type:complete len:117 (+) Transcript_8635:916-1266(+)
MNQMGGIKYYEMLAQQRQMMLTSVIDNSKGYYICKTQKKHRSRMNIIFRIVENPALEDIFIKQAEAIKIINIKGHPFNPGIRISMYNAMPVEGVALLCEFMMKFMNENPFEKHARM